MTTEGKKYEYLELTKSEEKIVRKQLLKQIDDLAMRKMDEFIDKKYKCNFHKKEEHEGTCRYIGTTGERFHIYKHYQRKLLDDYKELINGRMDEWTPYSKTDC
jgi:hypothetical protein